jgi:hypothetical protein
MTKEALELSLEALEYRGVGSWRKKQPAITAIKQALANDALEKKAENARELGLNYEPEQKSVAMADYMALTEKYVALKATQPEQEQFALKHRIAELEGALIGLQAQRTWVGLTADEMRSLLHLATYMDMTDHIHMLMMAEDKLKEKNNG